MIRGYRQTLSLLLMIVGTAMIVRGIWYSFGKGPGLSGALQAAALGALVTALGYARWRYWRQR